MGKMISPEHSLSTARSAARRERTLLCQAPIGQTVRLASIKGGHQFCARLASMGLMVGTQVKVLRTGPKGPCILGVKHSRIVLGRGAAHKVEVE